MTVTSGGKRSTLEGDGYASSEVAASQPQFGTLRLRPRVGLRRIVAVTSLVVVLCAVVPTVVSLLLPKIYGAQLELVLKPRADLSDTAVERAMLTEEAIVKSSAVLQPAATQTGLSVSALDKAVTTTIVGRSNILVITVADRDPARALNLLRGIERQYAAIHARDASIDPSAPNSPAITYSVLTPARLLEDPVGPRPVRFLAAGLLVGVLAGVVVALLLVRPTLVERSSPSP